MTKRLAVHDGKEFYEIPNLSPQKVLAVKADRVWSIAFCRAANSWSQSNATFPTFEEAVEHYRTVLQPRLDAIRDPSKRKERASLAQEYLDSLPPEQRKQKYDQARQRAVATLGMTDEEFHTELEKRNG